MTGLTLDGIGRTVGGEVHVEDVSLSFARGTLNVLLGATLAGKTTLMRLMAGLDRPTTGRILMDGVDVTSLPVKKRNVAMVYQQFINYPSLTVYENIASPMRVGGVASREIDGRVREAARLMRLEPYLDRTPAQLSGGQQQRTAIARALVKRADLVLMDEPLANLDYKLREELREELPRIFEGLGAIFVYATTEAAEALLLGGNTATLHQGRVTQYGPTAMVYRRPRDLTTARVFSDPPLNTMRAIKSGGVLALGEIGQLPAGGRFKTLPDGLYTLGFRAYHLSLDPLPPGALAVPSVVIVSEITGSESFVHLDAGGHRFVALAAGVREHQPGDRLTAWLDPARLFLFGEHGELALAPQQRQAATEAA